MDDRCLEGLAEGELQGSWPTEGLAIAGAVKR